MRARTVLVAAIAAAAAFGANAGKLINLGRYQVSGIYALERDVAGGISGLEASAVTYARDRNSLFFVGDEGTGVIEVSLTGQTKGAMAFNWAGTGSTKQDSESLAYLGNGVLVLGEERLYDAFRFDFVNGGTAALNSSKVSISNASVGNDGLEGISYDPRNGGSFVSVKQWKPQDILAGTLDFATGVSGMTTLFDPALMGLTSLSDVATLSPVDALLGTSAADNLLVLSLASRKLVEIDRTGRILSSFDLSGVLPNNGIEGVTVDENGTIYLVAEQLQDGTLTGLEQSQLIVLTASVPEPETWTMMVVGLAGLFAHARRKRAV